MSGDGFGHGKSHAGLESEVVNYRDRINIYKDILHDEIKRGCPSIFEDQESKKCRANMSGNCEVSEKNCPILHAIMMGKRAGSMNVY